MTKPQLYSYFRSSCAWRVRVALAFKGVDYEYKAVNLIKSGGEQHSEEYKSVNPFNQVPALVVTDQKNGPKAITQSLAIIEYLEEVYPTPSLLPKSAIDRATVRGLAECIVSGIQPLQNLPVLMKAEELGGDRLEWAKHFICDRFEALEVMLKETSGKCSFGDNITLADACLVPQVYNARRFQVDMSVFPIISRICSHLETQEPFIKSHPKEQPDCPPELK